MDQSFIKRNDRNVFSEAKSPANSPIQSGFWDFDLLAHSIRGMGDLGEIFGLAANSDFTVETFFDRIHADDLPAQRTLFEKVISGTADQTFTTEYRIVLPDSNKQKWVRAVCCAFFDEGSLVRTMGSVTDITHEKSAIASIALSRERLQAALNASLTGTFRWDITNNDLVWDENLDRLFGMPPGQSVRSLDNFIECVHPEDRQSVIDACARCASQGADFDLSFRVVWPDGSVRWLDDKGKTYTDDDGAPSYMTGACVDITSDKLAGQLLAESEVRFRSTFENAAVGIAHVGLDGTWLFFNDYIYNLFGYAKDELNKLTFQDITFGPDLGLDLDFLHKLLNGEIKNYSMEKRYIRKDGSIVWASLCVSMVRDTAGEPAYFISIVQDISRRKAIEEDLAYQKTLLETVTENTDSALFLLDSEGRCKYLNGGAQAMTGLSLEQVQGRPLGEVLHPLHAYENLFIDDDFITGDSSPSGIRISNEEIFFRSDGTAYPVAYTASPIRLEGRSVGTVIEIRDISREKIREKQLAESEKRFRLFADCIDNLAWIASRDGSVNWFNQRWYDYTGTTLEEMRGWGWHTTHHPDHIDRVTKFAREVFAGDQPWEITFPLKGADGVYRWFLTRGGPIKDQDGNVVEWIGTSTNINDQKLAEEAIRQREQQFSSLAEALPQMIWLSDAEGNNLYYSKKWFEYSGIQETKSAWKYMVHPDDYEKSEDGFAEALRNGVSFRQEVRLRDKLGEYRWHLSIAEPIRDNKGVVTKWVGSLSDIHLQKNQAEIFENLVAERTRELQRSNEDLQRFAHVASHDMKEPIRKILTFGSRLMSESTTFSDTARHYLEKIDQAANRSYNMIDGVLKYSTSDSQVQEKEVDMNLVMTQIVEDIELLMQQKSARITFGPMPTVYGSEVLLYQAFYNLINNSLKFQSPLRFPVIRISAENLSEAEALSRGLLPDQPFCRIVVEDNGIGFSELEAEKIFGSFVRLHAREKYDGNGLGLSICKKVIERHGGQITAEGEPDKGARFLVVLPRIVAAGTSLT